MKRLQFTFKWRFIQSYYLVRLFLFLLRDQFDCHNVCCIAVIFYLDSWIPVCLSVCSGMNEETLNLEVAPYWRIVNMYFSPPPPPKTNKQNKTLRQELGRNLTPLNLSYKVQCVIGRNLRLLTPHGQIWFLLLIHPVQGCCKMQHCCSVQNLAKLLEKNISEWIKNKTFTEKMSSSSE